MNEKMREVLIETAREGKLITYSELKSKCDLDLDFEQSKDRSILGDILGEISTAEVNQGRPMLSSVVTLKSQTPLSASYGFFTLARNLQLLDSTNKKEEYFFWIETLKKVYEEWKK